jgi:hypothetical protein
MGMSCMIPAAPLAFRAPGWQFDSRHAIPTAQRHVGPKYCWISATMLAGQSPTGCGLWAVPPAAEAAELGLTLCDTAVVDATGGTLVVDTDTTGPVVVVARTFGR